MLRQTLALIVLYSCLTGSTQAQTFIDASAARGIQHLHVNANHMGGGAVIFDYDNDSMPDIYLTGGANMDALYRNINGFFVETTISAGLGITAIRETMGAVAGDLDNDGDRDLFVTTRHNNANLLFINQGDGTFVNESALRGITHIAWSLSATLGDYNLDGFLDIYVGNYIEQLGFLQDSTGAIVGFDHTCQPNFLYMNDGTGHFTEMASVLGVADSGCTLATAFTDYDQDADLDLYTANDFGHFVIPNQMLENSFPTNAFTNVSASSAMDIGLYGMGIAKGDYDEDGDFDYYVTNLGRNSFLKNNGNQYFTDVADSLMVANTYADGLFTTGWGTAFVDVENDSDLDLFVANGRIPAAPFIATAENDPNKLYLNDGDGLFTDAMDTILGNLQYSRGMAYGDFDRDGDQDLMVTNIYPTANSRKAFLFENVTSNGNNYVKVQLRGVNSNTYGIGALVKVHFDVRTLLQEIDGGSSHCSQHLDEAHFGLGPNNQIDSVVVIWPGGVTDVIKSVPVNQTLVVIEGSHSACAAPELLESLGLRSDAATLVWQTSASPEVGYELRGRAIQQSGWINVALPNPVKKHLKVGGLMPSTTYIWQVRNRCDSLKNSGWSDLDTFRTRCAPPWPIGSVPSGTSVQLSWPATAGALGYRLLGQNLKTLETYNVFVGTGASPFIGTNLPQATTYIWTVRALCGPLGTVYSEIIGLDTFYIAPPAPLPQLTGLSTDKLDPTLSIFPNPNQGLFHVNLAEGTIDRIQVWDMLGRQVLDAQVGHRHKAVQVSHQGLYLLRVTDAEGKQLTRTVQVQ